MPVPSPLHARTFPLCVSLNYREWAGYYAVSAYETQCDHEYSAIRTAAALIDISPLYKYIVRGPGALALVDRVITRDATKIAIGQVVYTPWCDERGFVIDDGTVTRIDEQTWRWTAADPSLRWFSLNAAGLDVTLEDVSERVAAIAVQGPTSRAVVRAAADADVDSLRYFRVTAGRIAGVSVHISRTGYTGDLGYEIWIPAERACDVWDALVSHGRAHDLRPAGMLALDVARIEAGLLLTDVDFISSRKALIDDQCYSPYEMGLGRLVAAEKRRFVGSGPLAAERARGHRRQIVGLKLSWPAVERLYDRAGLPTLVPTTASRAAVPVYKAGRQIGKATSTTWSPILKKLIALATIDRPHFTAGTAVDVEVTVEAVRHRVPAVVVQTPFFNPPRKTATTD